MRRDRSQFEDPMLTDQKAFASYARLFMDAEGAQSQGFLDWCWEKYRDGAQPSPSATGFGIDFYSKSVDSTIFRGIRE